MQSVQRILASNVRNSTASEAPGSPNRAVSLLIIFVISNCQKSTDAYDHLVFGRFPLSRLVCFRMQASPLDPRDRELLQHLHSTGGADVQSICDLLGVTRTAVRQRISRLEGAGLIVSALQSQVRGRPRHVYRVTAEGLHSLGENYRQLAVVLWQAISELDDVPVRQQLLQRVQNSLAGEFSRQFSESDTVDRRADLLAERMRASGFPLQVEHGDGLPILRETCCPFPQLAERDEAICQLERQVLSQALGAPLELRSRCRDGHGCCEFQVLQQPESLVEDCNTFADC
jgi:predicted ArsR family transcriptional regulator